MSFLKFEILCVLLVLGFYLLAVILVYTKVRQPARYNFEILSTDEMAEITLPAFRTYVNAIHSLGFDLVAHLRSVNVLSGVTTTLTLLYNRDTLDQAMVNEIRAVRDNVTVKLTCYAEFISEFEDDHSVCTNNSSTVGIFARIPSNPIYQLPEVNDPESLYSIHSALAASLNARKKRLPSEGEEITSLVDSIARSLDRQVGLGYFWLDESSRSYRLTIKGAAIMTAKSLWPLSMIRKRRAMADSRRIRRKFQTGTAQPSSDLKPQRSS